MWLERYRRFWTQRLDALGTELVRGKRERRTKHGPGSPAVNVSHRKDNQDS